MHFEHTLEKVQLIIQLFCFKSQQSCYHKLLPSLHTKSLTCSCKKCTLSVIGNSSSITTILLGVPDSFKNRMKYFTKCAHTAHTHTLAFKFEWLQGPRSWPAVTSPTCRPGKHSLPAELPGAPCSSLPPGRPEDRAATKQVGPSLGIQVLIKLYRGCWDITRFAGIEALSNCSQSRHLDSSLARVGLCYWW